MATIYINLYNRLNNDLSLPVSLKDPAFEIECLKNVAPDDGEAVCNEGRYRVNCSNQHWRDVVDRLRQSGRSLIYSVIQDGFNGETIVLEAGELNSENRHYTTRLSDAKQVFNYWFDEFVSPCHDRLIA